MKSRLALAVSVVALLSVAFPTGAAAAPSYVGTKKCGSCHPKELASWQKTHMAGSFEYLKAGAARAAKIKAKLDPEKEYSKDPNCLACHTTGYGKPGGFVDMASTPDMAAVGCEECHGAGSDYLPLMKKGYKRADLVKAGLVEPVTKEQCTTCHNGNMPVGTVVGNRHFVRSFTFESGKLKGTHAKFPLREQH